MYRPSARARGSAGARRAIRPDGRVRRGRRAGGGALRSIGGLLRGRAGVGRSAAGVAGRGGGAGGGGGPVAGRGGAARTRVVPGQRSTGLSGGIDRLAVDGWGGGGGRR